MLQVCSSLFETFKNNAVRYCHWKSNLDLEASLNGDTDLDILVSQKQLSMVEDILIGLSFIETKSPRYLTYLGIKDFIGMDYATGKIVHVHLHSLLVVGRKFLKNYRLEWEDHIFETTKIKHGIRVIDPAVELLILAIRLFLKSNFWARMHGRVFWKRERQEFLDLLENVGMEGACRVCAQLLGDDAVGRYRVLLMKQSFPALTSFGKRLPFYRRAHIKENAHYYFRYSRFAWRWLLNRKLRKPVCFKRELKRGILISIIGMDGSGKTTLIKELNNCFKKKLDIYNVYFGSGDGPSSILRSPLKGILNVMRKKTPYAQEKVRRGRLFKIARVVWAILVASEKKKSFRNADMARKRGFIVLADRFPQVKYLGFNDGPLLSEWKNLGNGIKRRISEWEYNIYNLSNTLYPDIALKLTLPEEEALRRKEGTARDVLARKKEVILDFPFHQNVMVYDIDATKSRGDVSIDAKRRIWEHIKNECSNC